MSDQGTFLEALERALREASIASRHDQVPPIALLWTDRDRRWELLLPRLRRCLPLFTLGTYDPQERIGPAYWLLCVIAGTLPQHVLPPGEIPILYLPGLSKQELCAIATLPRLIQPLAELQYRSNLWVQKKSGREWTLDAFLRTGLNIAVRQDTATKGALRRALPRLLDEPVARLQQEAPLDTTFFEILLTSTSDAGKPS